jgi:hypothetical protein
MLLSVRDCLRMRQVLRTPITIPWTMYIRRDLWSFHANEQKIWKRIYQIYIDDNMLNVDAYQCYRRLLTAVTHVSKIQVQRHLVILVLVQVIGLPFRGTTICHSARSLNENVNE